MSLNNLFDEVFASGSALSFPIFLLSIAVALLIGLFIALAYTFRTHYTKSFVITLVTLPCVVCMVIMMVNGNLGAGVAVAGAFSLVRFRSVPGTAKEIGAIFLAMGAGLATGMGYLGYAALFAILVVAVNLLCTLLGIGSAKSTHKTLRITIPEDLDYQGVFDDLFVRYTTACELLSVKTSSMGSLFRLSYDVTLCNSNEEKLFIDALRCRNGNLEIAVEKQGDNAAEL